MRWGLSSVPFFKGYHQLVVEIRDSSASWQQVEKHSGKRSVFSVPTCKRGRLVKI